MRKAKYIVIRDGLMESPVVFPEWLTHYDIARALVGVDGIGAGLVLSAGFVEIYSDSPLGLVVECSGESTSLSLNPGKHDALMIQKALGIGEE
jgi:hypothetical protein